MRRAVFALLTLACVSLVADRANAQGGYSGGGVSRPTVSPYLNLVGSNRFGIANYQTLVRPLIEQREAALQNQANIQQLQEQFQSGQAAAMRRGSTGGVGQTGHPSRYFTYLHYYPQLNAANARFAR
jgi:hypothetical protein